MGLTAAATSTEICGATSQAALSFANIPPEALLAGGAVVLAAIGGIALAAANSPDGGTIWQAGRRGSGGVVPEPLPRENAALVFGATGRMGRTVVQSVSWSALMLGAN